MAKMKTNRFQIDFFCLKLTIYIGRRKVCMDYKTDSHKLNIVMYRYQNSLYLGDAEMELK